MWDYAAGMPCPTCRGQLWICRKHVDQSWPHCKAIGIPCACNPKAVMPSDFMTEAKSETDGLMPRADSSDKLH